MMGEFKGILGKPLFRYLWGSQILSQVTINVMNFLLLAKLYADTGSTIATSLLWISYSLPALLAGPIAAATVDLVSRKKMLMITNLLQAVTIFTYLLISHQSVFILYAIVFIYSLLNQFYVPAEAAYLPSVVAKEHLPQANGIFLLTIQASLIMGFGFAGLLQSVIGFNGAVILCGSFLFIAFISTSFLKEIKPRTVMPDEFEKLVKTFFNTVLEGYRFIKNNKTVLYPILLILSFQAALAIIVVSLPVIASQILSISVEYAGVSIAVPAGIGAFVSSFFVPRLLKQGFRKKTIIEYSSIILFLTILALCYGVAFMPVVLRLFTTFLLLVVAGLCFVGIYVPTLTFLQASTPLWLRGRVLGNMYFMISLASIFPVLFSGTITEIFGIRTMLSILALGAMFLFIYSRKKGDVMIREEFK